MRAAFDPGLGPYESSCTLVLHIGGWSFLCAIQVVQIWSMSQEKIARLCKAVVVGLLVSLQPDQDSGSSFSSICCFFVFSLRCSSS